MDQRPDRMERVMADDWAMSLHPDDYTARLIAERDEALAEVARLRDGIRHEVEAYWVVTLHHRDQRDRLRALLGEDGA